VIINIIIGCGFCDIQNIIKFEVSVISLITLIILDVKKPNLIIVLLDIEGKKMEVMCLLLH